jgi:DNA-directed RNA polymerase specialized sigma24 family protein
MSRDLFARYVTAPTAEERDRLLADLLSAVARPVIERVVRSRLAFSPGGRADIEDAVAESLFETFARLRSAGELPPIANFEAYVTVLASRVAASFFNARFPERKRLRYRVRALLSGDARYRLWQSPSGAWLCGLEGCDGPTATALDLDNCRLDLSPAGSPDLAGLLQLVFERLQAPVELNALVSLVARLGPVPESARAGAIDVETLADGADTPEDRVVSLDWLRAVWDEVRDLGERQRVALVLSMRSAEGAAAWLLTDLGLVTFRDLAALLAIDPRELADLWNRLPLDDREIAARLGLERQQVINLRSAARQRLFRRMAARANIGGKSTT